MQCPASIARGSGFPAASKCCWRYTVLNFLAAYARPEVEKYYRKIERQIAHSGASTYVDHLPDALRRGEGKFRCIHSPILLDFS